MSCLNAVRKWHELGLPSRVLETHPDCADYLVNSRLIYPLAGYRNSSDEPDVLEQGLLKVEGVWKQWEEVKNLLMQGKWNYTALEGFTRKDRLHYDAIYPVHSLSVQQYKKVRNVALRFFENHAEADPGIDKDCVLQLITTALDDGNAPFCLEHCTIRVIRPAENQIEVYSFGAEMEEDQYRLTMPGGSWLTRSILTTVETKIGMGDFMEFREATLRRVTSIPLTSIRAERVLQRVNELNKSHLRFNYTGQNCYALAHEVMNETGYEMPDIHMTLGQLINVTWLNRHPLLASILDRESSVSMIVYNCAALVMGGLKMSEGSTDGAIEEPIGQSMGIRSFSRLIRSPSSLLTENCARINYHSLPFIAWQLEQPSTLVYTSTKGRPKMDGL